MNFFGSPFFGRDWCLVPCLIAREFGYQTLSYFLYPPFLYPPVFRAKREIFDHVLRKTGYCFFTPPLIFRENRRKGGGVKEVKKRGSDVSRGPKAHFASKNPEPRASKAYKQAVSKKQVQSLNP